MIARALLLVSLLVTGCASLDPDGLWVLPPLSTASLADRERPRTTLAVLGSSTRAGLVRLWVPGSGPLALEQVLGSVDRSYPLLSIARQERVLAEAKQLAALGAFDLKLGAGAKWSPEGFYENHSAQVGLEQPTGLRGLKLWGGYRLGVGEFDPTYDGRRVTNHGGEFAVGASLPLLRDGSIDESRRNLLASTLDREIAENEIAMLRVRYTQAATRAYWDWVAAGRRLAVASDLLTLADQRQAGVLGRVQRGDLPEIEAADNRRVVVRRQAVQVRARRDVERTAIALSLFLRDDQGRPMRPTTQALPLVFPDPAPPKIGGMWVDLELALRQRPDLRQVAVLRGRAGVDLRYAENQLLPQLDLFVAGSQDLDRTRPSATKGEFELTAGVEFSFPVQNRKARGTAGYTRAKIAQIDEKERYLRDAIEADVRDALSALRAAYEQIAQAREAAVLARRVAEAERRRFELGDSTILQLNLREVAAAEARLGEIKALLGYWDAAADYRAAVGTFG